MSHRLNYLPASKSIMEIANIEALYLNLGTWMC